MKKFKLFAIILILVIVTAFAVPIFSGCSKNDLRIGNWADYIGPGVINDFKAYYKSVTGKNIKVVYDDVFTTPEDMLNKVVNKERFDILCPSDYMVERMIKTDNVLPLKENLGNDVNGSAIVDYRKNISPLAKTAGFDDGFKYSSPYMWQTVGLSYNKTAIESAGCTLDDLKSWDILWNTKLKGKIKMKDSMRDTYSVCIIRANKTELLNGTKTIQEVINDYSDEAIAKVSALLKEQKSIRAGWEDNDGKTEVISGSQTAILPQWSGEAFWSIQTAEEQGNNDVDYAIPEEGSNLCFDAWVIPKTAKNIEAANLFINFMCRPDIAIRNMEEIGYPTCVATKEILDWINETYKDLDTTTDLSYFFGDIEGATSVKVDTRHFPTKEQVEKCAVMRDFPEEADAKILRMWEEKDL